VAGSSEGLDAADRALDDAFARDCDVEFVHCWDPPPCATVAPRPPVERPIKSVGTFDSGGAGRSRLRLGTWSEGRPP
jgi:hypothetical protein